MPRCARDRVTVDLRGLGDSLRAQAAAQHMRMGVFVRRAVALQLDCTAKEPSSVVSVPVGVTVKLTLRLSSLHAAALAARARQADRSQGAYVAGLLDGSPPAPAAPDRTAAIAALVTSTDQLAALSTDINAMVRLLRQSKAAEAARYRDRLDEVSVEVHQHLKEVADLLGDLVPARRGRPGVGAFRGSAPGR